jgi:TRAP-type C4-dicarboxylate transport system permease small subunit
MFIAVIFLSASTSFIFISAIMRTVKHPISWGLDIALLLFTWSTFLGADIAFRHRNLVRVDMFLNTLSPGKRKALEAVVYLLMLAAIIFMLCFGIKLTFLSRARVFQGIPGLSYSWIIASVPTSMTLMLITALIQVYQLFFPKNADTAAEKGDIPC